MVTLKMVKSAEYEMHDNRGKLGYVSIVGKPGDYKHVFTFTTNTAGSWSSHILRSIAENLENLDRKYNEDVRVNGCG